MNHIPIIGRNNRHIVNCKMFCNSINRCCCSCTPCRNYSCTRFIFERITSCVEGHVIYDVRGEEKTKLEVSDLLQRFEQAGGEANDRMILS